MPKELIVLLGCVTFLWSAVTPASLMAGEIEVGECKATYRHRVTLSVDRAGLIAGIPDEGSSLKAGNLVIQLKDDVPRASLAVATFKADREALIRSEQTAAAAAKLEYEAAMEANRQSKGAQLAYSQTHVARLKLQWDAAEWRVKAAEQEQRINTAERDQAQAELETYRVLTEIDGIVVQVFRHRGEVVQQGEPIVELMNTSELRIEGFLRLEDSLSVKTGLPVTVNFEIPGEQVATQREVKGQLGFVDVSVQPLSNRIRVWAIVPNPEGELREGLPVQMKIRIP